ncbi:hypothetical protein M408DRAFT_325583 [Serendipita vermifera MAFF 305830]|uniref:VIT domain-containing protein n=1 Tax=Serendipita vermifera MAFF 305830 TaxID=933852 RepID=A0A0C2X7P5_SERVB|nr:hypothetical protein M408DRAFT_325583 [Serendipita vermifera MAFF 305830]
MDSTLYLCGIFPLNNRTLDTARETPLINATCNCKVLDVYILTELVQEYVSNGPAEQQMQYTFPLSSSAAVRAFKAVIDSKVINGVVKEKGEAKRLYDHAISSGKQAGLLEKSHVDLFTVSLGNIKPGQRIVVHISYVSMISHDGGSPDALRLTIPITIASRYGQPPVPLPVSKPLNAFKLDVSIQMNAPIKTISSPTHPINMKLGHHSLEMTGEHDPNLAAVTLQDSVFLDKDIVIIIAAQKLDYPRCMAERRPLSSAEEPTHAYALTMVPKFDLPPVKSQEYIFLVDRSGSMSGQRIEAVRNALQIMLRSLPSRKTTFNIISFGSHNTSLWPTSQPYDATTVEQASQHVDTMDADYGGTELGSALNFAYTSKARSDPVEKPSTVVFILTDGDSYDLRGVVDVVASSSESAKNSDHLLRTFVLGVGDDVAVGMCETIARAGRGTAVFVGYHEKPDAKLVALLRASRGGVVENISIDWGVAEGDIKGDEDYEMVDKGDSTGAVIEQRGVAPPPDAAPETISLFNPSLEPQNPTDVGPQEMALPPPPTIQQTPASSALSFPIYPGFRCNIFAIIKQKDNAAPFASAVKIMGEANGIPVSLDVPVQGSLFGTTPGPHTITGGCLLHTLAARALIEAYEDGPASARASAEIRRLGLRYSLATSGTSFVAVEEASSDVIAVEEQNIVQSRGEEESDDEMGFGLFDDGDYAAALPDEDEEEAEEEGGAKEIGFASDIDAYQPRMLSLGGPGSSSGAPQKKMKMAMPVMQTHAMDALSEDPMALMSIPAPPPVPMAPGGAPRPPVASRSLAFNAPISPPSASYQSSMPSLSMAVSSAPAAPTGPPPLSLAALAKAQGFDGGFVNTPDTSSLLLQGRPTPPMPKALEETSLPVEDKETVWMTILALTVLQKQFSTAQERDAWSLMAEKAMEFVRSVFLDGGMAETRIQSILGELENEATRSL